MARAGPRKIREYSLEFKLTAVQLSEQPGIQVQAVAAALDIHLFMPSASPRRLLAVVLLISRTSGRGRKHSPLERQPKIIVLECAAHQFDFTAIDPNGTRPVGPNAGDFRYLACNRARFPAVVA